MLPGIEAVVRGAADAAPRTGRSCQGQSGGQGRLL
jgi:hypothetical protein